MYPSPTEKLLYTNTQGENDGEQLKGSSSQADEGTPRPDSTSVPKLAANARISGNHKNPQSLRRILWTKHDLPTPKRIGEKGIREKPMEHGQ